MAKMPSAQDFGAPVTPRSRRTINGYRGDIVANAEAREQTELASIYAEGGEQVAEIFDGIQKQQAATATIDFAMGKIELDSQFALDQDFETAPARYEKALAELRTRTGGGLAGKYKADFDNTVKVSEARGNATQKIQAFEKRKNFSLAEYEAGHTDAREAMLSAPDGADRAAILTAEKDKLDALVSQGMMTPTEAQKRKDAMGIDFAVARVQSQPGEQQLKLLQAEGWDGTEKLPRYKKNGTLMDFIPADMRAKMAKQALPGMRADVSKRVAAEALELYPDDVDAQRKHVNAHKDKIIASEADRIIKSEYAFEQRREADEVEANSQSHADKVRGLGGLQNQVDSIRAMDLPAKEEARAIKIVEADAARNELITNRQQREDYDAATEAARSGTLTDDMMTGLSPRQRTHVERLVDEQNKEAADPDYKRPGDGGKTWKAYYTDSTGENRRSFAELTVQELSDKYELGVTKAQFENHVLPKWEQAQDIVARQDAATKKAAATEARRAGPSVLTDTERKEIAYRQAFDKDPGDDDEGYGLFIKEYQRRVSAAGAEKHTEKQAVLDGLVRETRANKIIYDKSDIPFSGDAKKSPYMLTPDNLSTFAKDASLPAEERQPFVDSYESILKHMRRAGTEITRENIIKTWRGFIDDWKKKQGGS